jgi:xylose dehydrogenase (NAD/NADP)
MSERLKFGIIGAANIAQRRFMPGMLKCAKAEVVAVASRDIAKAEAFRAQFGIHKAYGNYDALLADSEINAVYIPLPNHLHAEWTIKAADSGKHVLCEKPLTLDAGEALKVVEHCKSCGVKLMEAFMYRLNPRTIKMKQLVDEGIIGEPRVVLSDFAFNLEPRHSSRLLPDGGAGSLMDVGCYCVNVSRYLFGAEPVAASAFMNPHPEIGCDTTFSGILDFGGGRSALFNSSFETAFRSSLTVAGTEGVVRVNKPFTPPEEGKIGFSIERRDGSIEEIQFDAVDQFQVEIDAFSSSVIEDQPVPLDPEADAVANMRAIDLLRAAAVERRLVEAR